jgi:hypothetical protein
MKALKIIYITSCGLLAIFSLALLGASGHTVFNLKNPQNVFFISFSIVMVLIVIFAIISFFNENIKKSRLFLMLLLIGVVFKIVVFAKFLTIKSSVDIEPLFLLVWLGILIVSASVFILRYWKVDNR